MKDFYKLLFYHIHKSLLKGDGYSASKGTALWVLAFIQMANIICLLTVIDIILSYDFSFVFQNTVKKEIGIPAYLFVVFLNYTLFSKKNQDSTIEEYTERTLEQRKKGARITLIYGIASVAGVFILAPFREM